MRDRNDTNMKKVEKEIDGICPVCGSSQIGVQIGDDIFERNIICGKCCTIIECLRCGSSNIGYFESIWICGDCLHNFDRYPGK